jgi:hypothetical protein
MLMRPVFMLRATAASLVILTFASTAHAQSTPVPEATVGGINALPFDTAVYDALVMPSGKLIVPDDVQGRYPTLPDPVLANTREARANDTVPHDIALAGGAQYLDRLYLARSATDRRLSRRAPGGLIARCNPVRRPENCGDLDKSSK